MSSIILKDRPALSVRQPWAWLIVNGFKDVENRDWRTKMRGRVLVHAAKTLDVAAWDWLALHAEILGLPVGALPTPATIERGGLVGSVRITGCVDHSESPWFVGDYGFVLADAEAFPLQPCRGMPGFFRPQVASGHE